MMPKIEFRGKTYNSEFEMPPDVRQAYNRGKNKTGTKSLTDIVDMSPEVKAIYERALGKEEGKPVSSRPLNELPKTEDIYRQSAPDNMKHLPSDESVYQPSQSVIDPVKSTIEPESGLGMNRFVSSIVWAFILVAVAFIIMRFIL
ncbi:MAG TPA: hypothetical protein VMN99_09950 [Anaerolineales bacterium]|nr:hypothetical protein [Anaerolineales bacterium]